jgi:hypothetical protein
MTRINEHTDNKTAYDTWIRRSIAGIVPILLVYVKYVDPSKPTSVMPKCLVKTITGLDCPGCVGLRCTHAILNLQIKQAIDYNAFICSVIPILIVYYVFKQIYRNNKVLVTKERYLHWTIAAAAMTWMVYRNRKRWQ